MNRDDDLEPDRLPCAAASLRLRVLLQPSAAAGAAR